MRRRFVKMNGLGNDFAVFDATEAPFDPDPDAVRRLADRRLGIGFDQLLVLDAPRDSRSAAAYRIYNASGEPAEQCGNGARCLARLVAARARPSGTTTLQLDSPAGAVLARFEADDIIAVRMAVPDFEPAAIPLRAPARAPRYQLRVGEEHVSFGAVSMGNPHAVLQVENIAAAPVARIGPQLERHPFFPSGVNVGFMQVLRRTHLLLRVHERGVGETSACGTGACAAVAVAREQQLVDENVNVDVPGGRLMVSWTGAGHPVWLSGPAEQVFEGYIDV